MRCTTTPITLRVVSDIGFFGHLLDMLLLSSTYPLFSLTVLVKFLIQTKKFRKLNFDVVNSSYAVSYMYYNRVKLFQLEVG